MAPLAVVRHFLFAFDQLTFTAEMFITDIAVIKILIGAALIAVNTAVCTTIIARNQTVRAVQDTIITPDFPIAAIALTFSFRDTV